MKSNHQDKLDEILALIPNGYDFMQSDYASSREQEAEMEKYKQNNLKLVKRKIRAYIKNTVPDYSKVDRFEVIDNEGRVYAKGSIYGSPVSVELSYQDEGRTLKVFVKEKLK